MSFLLDTDICSAFLKKDQRVVSKVMLHFGGLHVSTVTVGELLTWARRAKAPKYRLQSLRDFLASAIVHEIDLAVPEKFGEVRAALLDHGIMVGEMDLLNAAVALTLNFIVVTHNTQDYVAIPGLTLDDWLAP